MEEVGEMSVDVEPFGETCSVKPASVLADALRANDVFGIKVSEDFVVDICFVHEGGKGCHDMCSVTVVCDRSVNIY